MDILSNFSYSLRVGLYLCTQGHCKMEINEKECLLTRGDAFVRSPLINITHAEASPDFRLLTIVEDNIEELVPIANDNVDIFISLFRRNRFHFSQTEEEQKHLLDARTFIEKLYAEIATPDTPERLRSITSQVIKLTEQATLLNFIRAAYLQAEEDDEKTRGENRVMVRFMIQLFQRYTSCREVGVYAEALHLSPNHFTRIIKRTSGRTPSEWIALITINQAKFLLRQNRKSIKEVAAELSFPEQFTFRKYFKHHTGLSPKEYRLAKAQT